MVNAAVALGKNLDTGQVVTLPQPTRQQGTYIIGVNGTGKSTLIANLIIQDIEQGLGLCLLDPHGDLTKQVIARCPEERMKDVLLLDLRDSSYPFGLNIFECPAPSNLEQVALTASFVMHVFEKVWGVGPETPLLAQVLRNVTYTLISNPGTTFAEIPVLLMDETARNKLIANIRNTQVKLFWASYNRLKEREQAERTSSTVNKVDAFLTQPLIANIVGQSKTTINFRQIMDSGKILLVQLDPRLEDISNLIGAVIIGQILNAAFSRKDTPEGQRRQFNFYADEYQRYATSDFATLLSEARKFGIATNIAHQTRSQLDEGNKGAATNAGNLIVFRVTGEDGKDLAANFDHTPPPPEIVGQEPIRTAVNDVLDHLFKKGHPNEDVMYVVNSYLTEAQNVVDYYYSHPKINANFTKYIESPCTKMYSPWYTAGFMEQGLQELNQVFYEVMRDKDDQKPLPKMIILQIAILYRCSAPLLKCCKYDGVEGKFKPYPNFDLYMHPHFSQYEEQLFKEFCSKTAFSSMEARKKEFDGLTNLIKWMRIVLSGLANDPILVDTGQYKERLGPQRTYQDMENQIANELTNMPNYQAKIKTVEAEYSIQTLFSTQSVTDSIFTQRIEQVRKQTRGLYGRKREEVEKEILERQERLMQPEQRQPRTRQEEEK